MAGGSRGGASYHDLELAVPLRALPRRHQMQHVHALVRLAVLLARLARQLDAPRREEGAPGGGVDHLDEPSVKIFWTEKSQSCVCCTQNFKRKLIYRVSDLLISLVSVEMATSEAEPMERMGATCKNFIVTDYEKI